MSTFIKTVIIMNIILSANSILASNSCEILNTPNDLLTCVLSNHPDLIRGDATLKQAELLEGQAAQRVNPEFSGKSVYGKSLGDNIINHELNISHTFELGGKRSARIEKANAEKHKTSSEILKTKEEIYIATLRSLYRIRQVHSEIKALNESLDTFVKIQKQFQLKPKLTPEQEVSLSIFQLAEGDYKLRKAVLESEENTLESGIGATIGKEFPHNKESLFPKRSQNWQDFSTNIKVINSSDLMLAQADLISAQAEMELAKSEAWPDIKFGPTLQSQTEGSIQYFTYGVNLTLPLPFFHANDGGKAVAAAGLSRAEQSLELKRRELTQKRIILMNQYQKSSQSLRESVSLAEIERKHKSVERQFERGVISSSLVIEAHRQMVDFTKSQNEQELNTLESLWRLKALEGVLFEGTL